MYCHESTWSSSNRYCYYEHITYDARELFRERIIRYFIDEYLAGHTPVPCT
ncbi:MAG: hypothetical protein KHX58_03525, partial [Coprobacillus sp.]|nr:hypothetical protein [Coprobacillus sp.]